MEESTEDPENKKKDKKKRGGGKKKKPGEETEEEKSKREAEEKAIEAEKAAEKLRIQKEKEAEEKAQADRITAAKRAMLEAAERDKMIVLADDIVEPFRIWTAFEETKAAIYYGKEAGVQADCVEFTKLRNRANVEREIISRFIYKDYFEKLKLEPVPGSHNGPRMKGDLSEDERVLLSFWEDNGGKDGIWKRSQGWDTVGKWLDLCEQYVPEERIVQPPLKKKEQLPPSIDEIVKHSIPALEGVVIHKARVQNISLFSNHLSGSIPTDIGLLSHLKILNLHGNNLTGPIPPSLVTQIVISILVVVVVVILRGRWLFSISAHSLFIVFASYTYDNRI
jgi:hypothetical protein